MSIHNVQFANERPQRAPGLSGFEWMSRSAGLAVLLFSIVGCSHGNAAPTRTATQVSRAYVDRCQDAVRRDMTAAIGAPNVSFDSGVAIAANPNVMDVDGEANVQPQGRTAERYHYSCSFQRNESDRLSRAGYSRAQPTAQTATTTTTSATTTSGGERATLVQRCEADVQRMLRTEDAHANVTFTNPRATSVEPQVINVEGDANVGDSRNPTRRYQYFCSFRNGQPNAQPIQPMQQPVQQPNPRPIQQPIQQPNQQQPNPQPYR
jgi:hypothetical protein